MQVAHAYASGETVPRWFPSLVAALVGSMVIALVGVLWRSAPSTYPFGPDDDFADSSLLGAADAGLAGWIALAVGVLGVLTASGFAYAGRSALRPLLAVAVLQAVALALFAPDIQILVLAAYLLAFTVPPVLLGSKIRSWLRRPRARWLVLLAAGAVVAVGVGSGVLRPETIADFGTSVGEGFANLGTRPLYLLLVLVVAMAWVGVVARSVRDSASGRVVIAVKTWIARWGIVATWVAALSPLPYVLSRLTWLTPWPLLAGDADLDGEPAIRLMGILLGLVAETSLWLTLGLIRPRGEVFPRWVPYVGGRTVPIMAAVIPGLVGALLLTIAGRSMIQQGLFSSSADDATPWLMLIMPLWLWGPALAIATLAYWLRRTTASIPTPPASRSDVPH